MENYKWVEVTDSYTSPSDENNKYKELYNLTPHQVFLLDWIDDMANVEDEVKAAGWRDLKQEKLDELDRLYKLGGAL